MCVEITVSLQRRLKIFRCIIVHREKSVSMIQMMLHYLNLFKIICMNQINNTRSIEYGMWCTVFTVYFQVQAENLVFENFKFGISTSDFSELLGSSF